MARNYYGEARELAALLRSGTPPEVEGAERIEDAISSGSTATEILMGVRFHIRQLLDDDSITLAGEVRAKAEELARVIGVLLE